LIAVLILLSIVAGLVFGWYGHKASLRIQAWGLKMNEQDLIFQSASGMEVRAEALNGDKSGVQSHPVPSMRKHPIMAATLR
jgi:hypothetical protein